MKERKQRIVRPKDLPRCPQCGSKNTVGEVMSPSEYGGKGYYCCNCLIEWDKHGNFRVPIYA
ncbi:hypothetical protein [Tissierella praeacuta]|uniref:hypothetical protein n=1 Tax=Tissierella praeacuta TaxID=43131 RepID=UPI00333EA04F